MAKHKLSQKKNASSINVLKTLKVLMKGDYSMKELINLLNKNEVEPFFNNSVISKYINTCRFCEYDIVKIHNRYNVVKIPFGLDLSMLDVDIIKSLQVYVVDEMSAKCAKAMNSFVDKISRFSNKQIARVDKDKLSIAIELFERAVYKQRKIKLLFKNQDYLECVPLNIFKGNDKTYFNVFNKKVRNIDISRLSGVQMLGQTYIEPFGGNQVVVFKLTGALAKRYEPRVNEKVSLNQDGSITVTNKNENKELLFSRLLRYDDKCEIIRPIGYREDMKALINEMLQNYEVS